MPARSGHRCGERDARSLPSHVDLEVACCYSRIAVDDGDSVCCRRRVDPATEGQRHWLRSEIDRTQADRLLFGRRRNVHVVQFKENLFLGVRRIKRVDHAACGTCSSVAARAHSRAVNLDHAAIDFAQKQTPIIRRGCIAGADRSANEGRMTPAKLDAMRAEVERAAQAVARELGLDPDALRSPDIHPQDDGTLVIDGAAYLREINRALGWQLPCDGPKTLNGLITEALEHIPDSGICLQIGAYRLEILQAADNRVKSVRAWVAEDGIAASDDTEQP